MSEPSAKRKLLAALLAGAVGLMPAAVRSNDASSEVLTTTHITAEVPFTAADVDELANDIGISSEEAELRLTLERASVGFEPALWKAFPDTFGGVWLETDGPPGLTVALTDDADDALSTVQSMFSVPEAVRTVTVEHTYADLVALQEKMIADRTLLQLGEMPASHALSATGGNYDLDIDVEQSRVVVHLHDLQSDVADAFRAMYDGDWITVEGNASVIEACTVTDCRCTLRGGLKMDPSSGIACTSAFSAVSQGSYYVLSAEHCTGATRWHAGEQYGSVTLQLRQGRVDVERHFRPWPSAWYVSASILVDGSEIRPIYYHITWDATTIGTRVGMAGRTSGTTRGFIESKDYSPGQVPGGNRFLKADYCADVGDSGGSIFNTNTAYGIHHGGGPAGCSNNPNDYGLFGNIVYAKDAMGVEILASP